MTQTIFPDRATPSFRPPPFALYYWIYLVMIFVPTLVFSISPSRWS